MTETKTRRTHEEQRTAITEIISNFPATFALVTRPADTFRISAESSFFPDWDSDIADVQLYLQIETANGNWQDFGRDTADQIRNLMRPAPITATPLVKKGDTLFRVDVFAGEITMREQTVKNAGFKTFRISCDCIAQDRSTNNRQGWRVTQEGAFSAALDSAERRRDTLKDALMDAEHDLDAVRRDMGQLLTARFDAINACIIADSTDTDPKDETVEITLDFTDFAAQVNKALGADTDEDEQANPDLAGTIND